MNQRSNFSTRITASNTLLVCATAAIVLGGCQKTALRSEDTRSQYDQYDQARNQRAEPYFEDEFGKRNPNLRGRLIVRD